jgi:molybdenum cofactor synthesis domain-containing protein
MYRVGIITASDKGSAGQRVDVSGQVIVDMMASAGYEVVSKVVLPDEVGALSSEMIRLSDEVGVELILTTGGTGFSQRDVTPEATRRVVEREAPGIAEAIRLNSLSITPKGMLSRGFSGIRGRTLIINLPGSPKAVRESLTYILEPLFHGIQILVGDDGECGTPENPRSGD